MVINKHRVLLVEDNPGDALLACERLAEDPDSALQIVHAATMAQALAQLRVTGADAVLLDLDLPDSQGLDTLRSVRTLTGDAPVIVLSGRSEPGLRQRALAEGAEDVFTKDEAHSRLFYRSVLFGIERNRARVEHRRLENLLDATPDAILVVNDGGIVRYVNQAALDLFRLPREGLQAENLAFSTTDDQPIEITIRRPGDDRACEMRVVRTEWDGEHCQLASIRDITVRKQAEQLRSHASELKLQNQRITEASRLKSEFLATISHEIRTPMNAIVGLSYLLGHTRLDHEQADLLSKVQVASRTLMGLMNDVLDLSKIEAGQVLLETLPFDMPELLRELGQLIAPLARGKPIELVIHAPGEVPRMLAGDITRVRQILINLLGNSIKFTERGHVHLHTGCQPREDGRVDLLFTVRDTGIGMSADELARIFRPYTQTDASITRRFGGTGLGLSIVRQLVDLMGGQVRVSSEVGVGSEFQVTLPMQVQDASDGLEDPTPAFKLLVAEAPDAPGPSVRALALDMGWRVCAVDSVAALVERLKLRLHQGMPPDVVVVDPQLQDAQALQALSLLKASRGARGLPPLLFVAPETGDAGLQRSGGLADGRLGRQPTAAALFNLVNGALVARGGERERLASFTHLEATGALCLAGVRVLVVDDSDINREVASRVLSREGAVVALCSDGHEAVEALRHNRAVDLVLMDLQMPGMDGTAATHAIRTELDLPDLPVLALTAGALEGERQRALEAGMDDFICKPLNPPALVRAVRRHVERARGSSIALQPRVAEAPPLAPHWPRIHGIEMGEVAKRLDGDVDVFASLMGRLMNEYGDLAAQSQHSAHDLGDAAARERLAARLHKLRGSAGILGANALHRLAGVAEQSLRTGAADGLLPTMMTMMAAELRAMQAQTHAWLEARAATELRNDIEAPAAAPSPARVQQLRELLYDQDLEAQRMFRGMAASLRAVMPAERYTRLRQAIDGLDFAQAAGILVDNSSCG